ncbi:MAG: topoisomerase DNA-binding C4 zinc finger domain-containing protein [Clostridia bacterium]|nr:topoisomerase DNA-binding C4 zinc finger domain-containing protein [Clostridia bacterium]
MTICPCCGSKLVERIGAYGMFVGCSGYPNCRYKRPNWNK